ncbi:MAG: nucleotidyltransferase domain-containing protein [Gammaproteobacteria bacterium]|nr:nucleotidyltransferase domain-containing protein [Gammaproteobacteria bacterium]
MDISAKLELVKNALVDRFGADLVAIYLFGSTAQGLDNQYSDMDIGFLSRARIAPKDVWEIGQELAVTLKQNVDLIELKNASTVMRMQIAGEGKRIYCSDEIACENFEDYIFSSYARLNEERKDIIADIKKRGSVYGR